MSPVAIKSSVKASGFDRDNKIDTWRIISLNPQFAAIEKDEAQRLVSTIEDVLVPYFEEHKQIPKNCMTTCSVMILTLYLEKVRSTS